MKKLILLTFLALFVATLAAQEAGNNPKGKPVKEQTQEKKATQGQSVSQVAKETPAGSGGKGQVVSQQARAKNEAKKDNKKKKAKKSTEKSKTEKDKDGEKEDNSDLN